MSETACLLTHAENIKASDLRPTNWDDRASASVLELFRPNQSRYSATLCRKAETYVAR